MFCVTVSVETTQNYLNTWLLVLTTSHLEKFGFYFTIKMSYQLIYVVSFYLIQYEVSYFELLLYFPRACHSRSIRMFGLAQSFLPFHLSGLGTSSTLARKPLRLGLSLLLCFEMRILCM